MTWRKAYALVSVCCFLAASISVLTFIIASLISPFARKVLFLTLNSIQVLGTVLIYIIYIVTYFTVRRKVNASQLNNPSPLSSVAPQVREPSANPEETDKEIGVCKVEIGEPRHSPLQGGSKEKPENNLNACKMTNLKQETVFESKMNIQVFLCAKEAEKNSKSISETKKVALNNKVNKSEHEVRMAKKQGRIRPEIELLKRATMTITALLITWFPLFMIRFYRMITGSDENTISNITHLFCLINSSVNALIIIGFSTDIRNYIKNMMYKYAS